ncbi:MAG: Gfo/Idh/MocA family oxidoreductase [Armatimonadota bacterium]|nr:Gfo/Idh/MocA family oxidoreductase [Armatimonadota bacterium]
MRLGFIGGYGHHYLRHLLPEPGAEHEYTVAVAGDGHDAAAARQLDVKTRHATWYDDPLDLFDAFQPDVVSIGAMYGYNGDIAALALERDIAVVSDKPIAATWEQLQRLRELTAAKPRMLLTEFPFRAQPGFRAARAAVADGHIGEVVLATAQKSYRFGSRPAWFGNRADYGGTMLWVAAHGIDAIRFCTGQNFQRVIGVQGNLSRPVYGDMEDHCVALFEMANGGSAVVHADYLRPTGAPSHGDDRLRVAGSRGIVEVRAGRCRVLTGDEPERDITKTVTVRPVQQELLAAIRGESHEFYSTEASLQMAEILLRARDAADSRQWREC